MNKTKTSFKIFFCFLITFLLSGCWSSREINNLAIINAMGVDQNEKGEIVLSVAIVKPNNLFPQESTVREDKEDSFLVESASGKTLYDAIEKLSSTIADKVYLGHVNVVVFGEKAAQGGMEESLDFFKRENEFRPNILFFVTKGLAENVMKATPNFNPTPGTEMYDLFKNNIFSGTKTVEDLSQFTESMTSNTMDPVTGVIGMTLDQDTDKNKNKNQKKSLKSIKTSQQTKDTHRDVLKLQDTAVFKGSKLIGYLNESETKGLMWIKGKMKNSSVELDCNNQSDNGSIKLQVQNSDSSMIPSSDSKKMTVKIKADASIMEISCKNKKLNQHQMKDLNRYFREKIEEEVTQTLLLAQKNWETDIFGFGKAIYRKHPSEWDKLSASWRNGGLKNLNVVLTIDANISRYGLTTEPSKANESR
ncbi:Ger(x)C family spore germination protein [Bacillus sp. APMAM]|nr:Ger(x)C family spore germination protein [Bacillus sp. APMAM]RTZ57349.1 Ger(x)C family spore germination protein [Bacillus sp. SAJ1]